MSILARRRPIHSGGIAWVLLLASILTACGEGGTPPSLTIIAPSNDAVVSGSSAIQVTLGETTDAAEVRVYARSPGSQEDGQLIGTVNTSPYIVTWNTASYPSKTNLELYAKAIVKGTSGASAPVRVQVQNASAPTMKYLVAYNLPAGLTAQSVHSALTPNIDVQAIRAQPRIQASTLPSRNLKPLATEDRQFGVEWAWVPVEGVSGYRILKSVGSIAGPYEVVKSQAASAGSVALEKYSIFPMSEVKASDRVYGTVRSTFNGGADSAMSNAETAVFLDAQQVASPVNGQSVADGRPILTWTPLQGTTGYLYFVCDRPCTQEDAKFIWTNYPDVTTNLSATYSSNTKPLAAGTYYWWVAGVRQEKGITVSMSYSEQRKLVVP